MIQAIGAVLVEAVKIGIGALIAVEGFRAIDWAVEGLKRRFRR